MSEADIVDGLYYEPYVPRPHPTPIPDAAWNDEPTYCLQVNGEWVSHLLGVIIALDQPDTWIGDKAEIDAAREQVNEIMTALMEHCEMVNPFIVGEIRLFAHTALPDGWESCYGQALSRTDFADLFAAIGTVYGVGDGSTTFNVPDLRRRFLAGIEPVMSGEFDLGHTGGEETHVLTTTEMPAHTHTGVVSPNNPVSNRAVVSTGGVQTVRTAGTSDSSGGGAAHENRPPWGVVVPAIYSGVLDA